MPNWCQNKLRVEGSVAEIELFRKTHFDVKNEFDFNTITPMPKELEETPSPENENLLYAFYNIATDRLTPTFLDKERCTQIRSEANAQAKAEIVKKLHDQFGFVSWYQWSIANWGTKWNACDTFVEDIRTYSDGGAMLTIDFSTAWSHPQEIYEQLAKQYPNLTITAQFDEESGEYYGSFRAKDGDQETQIERGYRSDGPFSYDDDEDFDED